MSQNIVSVLGCGWLGLPLAQNLIALGHKVKGSTTSSDKIEVLKKAGIVPYQFSISPPRPSEVGDFFSADVLFLNIPFSRDLEAPTYYIEQVQTVIQKTKGTGIRTVIFASSTSVYSDDCVRASEDAVIVPEDIRSIALLAAENLLQSQKEFKTVVLRFAGLYGGERKIGKFLAGKTGLPEGDSPVNLVHLEDCIAAVTAVIEKNIQGEILNVCSDKHPTRRELYTKAAQSLGLPAPQFSAQPSRKTKIVTNEKIKKLLDLKFLHPDPMEL